MSEILLSAAMIVRDEERHLDECLASLAGLVDEVVVVDTGSNDTTKRIARRRRARVFDFRWCDDFAAARNYSLEQARGQWILYIDADERVREGDRRRLERLLQDPRYVGAWVLLRAFLHLTPYREMRLFRNHPEIRFEGVIHENMWGGIATLMRRERRTLGHSDLVLEHVGYVGDQRAKRERNLPLLCRSLEATPWKIYNWCHLAATLSGLGRLDEADAAFRRAVDTARERRSGDLNDSLAFSCYLSWRLQLGRPIDGLLEEGLALYPRNLELQWFRGRRLLEKGDFAGAISIFSALLTYRDARRRDRTLAYDPRMFAAWPYAALATCHFKLGNYAESARHFALASAEEPGVLEYRVKTQLAERLAERRAPTSTAVASAKR